MRRFLILFLAACTACAAWAAPRITPDGEILCGPLRLRLAWFDGEWHMTVHCLLIVIRILSILWITNS